MKQELMSDGKYYTFLSPYAYNDLMSKYSSILISRDIPSEEIIALNMKIADLKAELADRNVAVHELEKRVQVLTNMINLGITFEDVASTMPERTNL